MLRHFGPGPPKARRCCIWAPGVKLARVMRASWRRRKQLYAGISRVELVGLEPTTSWVRYGVGGHVVAWVSPLRRAEPEAAWAQARGAR